MTGALDGTDISGSSGRDLFSDYTAEEREIYSQVKGGRGLVVAPNLEKPVITSYCVVCCCIKLAQHLMWCRNSKDARPSHMKVTTMWEHLVKESCRFAKDLTEEDDKVNGEKAILVGKVCMAIKRELNHERTLIFLRTPTIPGFSTQAFKKAIEYNWVGEVKKKLTDFFDPEKFVDIMVPIRIGTHWVCWWSTSLRELLS
jgi:hypothetical protein